MCDDGWGMTEANVVCRQAGFSDTGAIPRPLAFFGEGTVDIALDEVSCVGTEQTLLGCMYETTNDCSHREDAGVTCQQCKSFTYTQTHSLTEMLLP